MVKKIPHGIVVFGVIILILSLILPFLTLISNMN